MAATEMPSEALSETILDVEAGDHLTIETIHEEYDTPFEVVAASPVESWRTPVGDDWTFRTLEVERWQATRVLAFDATQPTCRLHTQTGSEPPEPVTRLDIVQDADSEDVWFHHCGRGPITPRGGKTHHGHRHPEKPRDLRDHPPSEAYTGEPPGELTEGDIVAVADHYETLAEVATDLEVPGAHARIILEEHGVLDDIEDTGEDDG